MDQINDLITEKKTIQRGGDTFEYVVLRKTLLPREEPVEVNSTSSEEESPVRPKRTRHKQMKQDEEEEKKRVEEINMQTQSSLVIRQVLTKHIPKNDSVPISTIFKYFVPSTELFYQTYPTDKVLYLVQWQNFSLTEATWILESEVNPTIDRDGIVDKFNETWNLDLPLKDLQKRKHKEVLPFIQEMVPTQLLIPSKIIQELPQVDEAGKSSTMYRVKWPGTIDVFVSDEVYNFFTTERNASLLQRWSNAIGRFPITFNDEEEEVQSQIEEGFKSGQDILFTGGYGKRTAALGYMFHAFKKSRCNKAELIVCDESTLPYYTIQLPYLFPGVQLTYIVKLPTSEVLESLYELELYDGDKLKPQIVVLCCKKFTFKKGIKFECMLVDVQEEDNMTIKTIRFGQCERFIAISRNEKTYDALTAFLQCKARNEIVKIRFDGSGPSIYTTFVMIKMQQKQGGIYYDTMESIQSGKSKISLAEDMRRVLLFPNVSSFQMNVKGMKMTVCEKFVQMYRNLGKKVVLMSPIAAALDYIKKVMQCKYVSWSNSMKENIQQASEFVNKKATMLCVDSNAYNEGVDLSEADCLIMLDNDYTTRKVEEICWKWRLGMAKDLKIVYFVFEDTIDEDNAAMMRCGDGIFSLHDKSSTARFSVLQTKKILGENLNKEIAETNEKLVVLRTGSKEDVEKFETMKRENLEALMEEEKKRAEEQQRVNEEERIKQEEKNRLYREKKSMKIVKTKSGMKNIEYLEINDDTAKKMECESVKKDDRKRGISDLVKDEDIRVFDLNDDNMKYVVDEDTKGVTTELQKMYQKKIEKEEAVAVAQRMTCMMLRYGLEKKNWPKGVFQQFSTKAQRQVKEIGFEGVHFSKKIRENSEKYASVLLALKEMEDGKEGPEYPTESEWGGATDVVLLMEVKRYGLECPGLWLKNLVIKFMLSKLGYTDERERMEFVTKRCEAVVGFYLTNARKEPTVIEDGSSSEKEKEETKKMEIESKLFQSTVVSNTKEKEANTNITQLDKMEMEPITPQVDLSTPLMEVEKNVDAGNTKQQTVTPTPVANIQLVKEKLETPKESKGEKTPLLLQTEKSNEDILKEPGFVTKKVEENEKSITIEPKKSIEQVPSIPIEPAKLEKKVEGDTDMHVEELAVEPKNN
ncbi:hypothetical protein EIN_498450 [Entamoeba invadens IP1]|uniref:Helicase C-terminal domain-containing protein n=1 Tax=Entamoeba invadens IP1 TaxID=370355 RepID=A0A0A1UG97_ENTIV|nr:hypothetical protein EIN_498450 [Entamoeba invadens IP1]ELP94645.1 hypothetical protein EIN_498450 [Entamoeba invadens IP1]|eukprot:XP_004261416.1 hypothetical protein EIN_498450 [Entamoeba invadens IP1]